jgi:hypothetical protein
MTRLLLSLLLGVALPVSADSFLIVTNGRAITNGMPVNVKALKSKYASAGSFFWFSVDGKPYIVRDPNVLQRVNDLYKPVFETGADFTVGEQLGLFAQQMAVFQQQVRVGLEPRAGEDARTAARRLELRMEQNRLAARQNELAKRANASAARLNDYAARLPELNRRIEAQLRELGLRLVEQGIAVEAD